MESENDADGAAIESPRHAAPWQANNGGPCAVGTYTDFRNTCVDFVQTYLKDTFGVVVPDTNLIVMDSIDSKNNAKFSLHIVPFVPRHLAHQTSRQASPTLDNAS